MWFQCQGLEAAHSNSKQRTSRSLGYHGSTAQDRVSGTVRVKTNLDLKLYQFINLLYPVSSLLQCTLPGDVTVIHLLSELLSDVKDELFTWTCWLKTCRGMRGKMFDICACRCVEKDQWRWISVTTTRATVCLSRHPVHEECNERATQRQISGCKLEM